MAMAHWTNEDTMTQVMWNLRNDIENTVDEIKDRFDHRVSEDVPVMFFHVDGGGDYGTGEGYDLIFSTVGDPFDQEPDQDIEFAVTSEVIGTKDVLRTLDIVQREVDGVTISTVDADAVLEMLAEWFALNAA